MKPRDTGSGGGLCARLSAAAPRHAFTLLELLAVIAVIMLLAALLLPVLGRAKARARAIHCINNGHQIALAAITYAADSDDWLPPNEIPLTDPSWVGQPNNGFYDTSTLLDPKHTLLAPYLRSLPIWKCAADTTQWYRSYSVNGAVGTKVVSLSPTDARALQPLLHGGRRPALALRAVLPAEYGHRSYWVGMLPRCPS